MSAERQPTSVGERLESIYSGVETRTAVLLQLWERAQSLPIPRRTDSEKQREEEGEFLMGSLDPFFEARPELRDKLARVVELREIYSSSQIEHLKGYSREKDEEAFWVRLGEFVDNPDVIARKREEETLLSDPNIVFLLQVYDGIENLVANRRKLRDMQGVDEVIDENGLSGDTSKYDRLFPPGHPFKGNITRALYGRFSVNLFILSEEYRRREPRTSAVSNGVINWISDSYSWKDIFLFRKRSTSPLEDFERTLNHEEFHSFAEGFKLGAFFESARIDYEMVKKLIDITPFGDKDLKNLRRLLKMVIADIDDASREEFLAEFAESANRSNIPHSTFKRIDRQKTTLLQRIAREQGKLLPVARRLDAKRLRGEIRSIYEVVDANIPERRLQVDALFALFPPSKIRFIRRVVNRWVAQSKAA